MKKHKPTRKRTKKKIATKRRRKNPTTFEKDLELYELLHSLGEPTGFSFWIQDFSKIIHIEPIIPELPEWGKLYPVLTFPFDINKDLPTDKNLIKIADILAYGIIPSNLATVRGAKAYLYTLNSKRFTSDNKMQALAYLRKYHALKQIYPEGHVRAY